MPLVDGLHEIGKSPRGTLYFKTCPVNKRLFCLVKLPYPCPSVVITQAQYFGFNVSRSLGGRRISVNLLFGINSPELAGLK